MAETLITSSVLILGICMLRFLLKGRISPRVQYGMWSIAALRLSFPLLYPFWGWLKNLQSRFSVMNVAVTVRENLSVNADIGPVMVHPVSGQDVLYAEGMKAAGRAAAIDWQFLILMIWLAGSILLFLWMIWMNIHFSRRIYFQRERYTGSTYGGTNLPVYQAKDLSSPCFMVYLGDKAIYLPSGMINEPEKARYALIHEVCHAKQRDHLWSILRCILLCVYWINPLVWAAAFLSKRDCELSCDAAAVAMLGEDERFNYGRALIEMASAGQKMPEFFCVPSEMNNGKRAIKERVVILAKHPRMNKITGILILSVLLGLVLCTYTGQNSQKEIYDRSRQWAELFCERDGQALKEMYNPEHSDDFYQMEQVQSQSSDEFVSFGWSSPWPMDGRYEVISEGKSAKITYYAMTSDPHRWVWKEWLTWKKVGGTWYVDQEMFKEYDHILSADEFEEAYRGGISDTAMNYGNDRTGEVLNEHAQKDPVYQRLFVPEQAMEFLLNLHGGHGTVVTGGGVTTAVYTFSDQSQAAVNMMQPYGADGIWIPAQVVPIPADLLETEQAERSETLSTEPGEGSLGTVTSYDVVLMAGVSDVGRLNALVRGFPEPDRVEGLEDSSVLNVVECYEFPYKEEGYELQISYEKADRTLDYIAVQRVATGERMAIYETPENLRRYDIEIPEEKEVRDFFENHKNMEDYLTYSLPDELKNGGYLESAGTGGGNLFITSDQKGKRRLEELSRHVDESSVPVTWTAAGAAERYNGGVSGRIEKGNLMNVGLPWNHSLFVSDPVSIADCEAPALIILAEHDLYTPAALDDAEKEYGRIADENRTSRMWYVFFAHENSDVMYSISLNADLYEREDVLRVARSVHFKDHAW